MRPPTGRAATNYRLLLVCLLIHCCVQSTRAQFLFTYEINQEDEGSRVPKSSLFDPSSFKIVTPSQLQSSYQKISSQLESVAAATSAGSQQQPREINSSNELDNEPEVAAVQQPQLSSASSQHHVQPTANQQPATTSGGSLLKQTSAALQSFAELFSLGPSSSPAPLGSGLPVDQQAEARSLHEHWTQQQQKAHSSQPQQSAQLNHQFATGSLAGPSALSSFTTNSPSAAATGHQLIHHHNNHLSANQQPNYQPQQSSQAASYWLTANPLNSPDGNYLVAIKQQRDTQQQQQPPMRPPPQQQPQQVVTPASLVDNLLALGHRSLQTPASSTPSILHQHQQQHQSAISSLQNQITQGMSPLPVAQFTSRAKPQTGSGSPAASVLNSAQASFMSTPTTSYYPAPTHQHQQPPQPQLPAMGGSSSEARHHAHHVAPLMSPQPARPPIAFTESSVQQQQTTPLVRNRELIAGAEPQLQLRPPANLPENFALPSVALAPAAHHKSAEETLISYRQQQQSLQSSNQETGSAEDLHQQQQPQQTRQGNLYSSQLQQPPRHFALGSEQLTSGQASVQQQPQQKPKSPLGDIPKVSPQIYESFLLQQKDQHEKHMELLKQQQEINRLMEQKRKQQADGEKELRRRKKKEEMERETRKKQNAQRELELAAARKSRQEQEERQRRRQEAEEADRKRAAAEAAEQLQREQLQREQQQRELAERREREAKLKRQAEEEREQKLRQEREREAAELKRKQEEEAAAAQAQAEAEERQRRQHEQQLEQQQQQERQKQRRNYLAQQEELKKLLELKQREDDAIQSQRRRQVAMQQQQQQQPQQQPQSARSSQSARANRLAAEIRERTGTGSAAQSWGTRGSRTPTTEAPISTITTLVASTTPSTTTTSAYSLASSTGSPSQPSTQRSARFGETTGARRNERVVMRRQQRQKAAATSTTTNQSVDEKLIRQKIPLYSGPGQYGLYRGGANDSTIANDLAALLDSVTLPPSSSTTTSTTTSTTPPPSEEPATGSGGEFTSSSLSPLLSSQRDNLFSGDLQQGTASSTTTAASRDQAVSFDDDVPRRPARGLARPSRGSSGPVDQQQAAASSSSPNRQQLPVSARSPQNETSASGRAAGRPAHIGLASLPADADNDGIPGRAGVEYPVLSAVPPTSFSCSRQPLNGYYADTETACQVVHLCQGGVQSSILCPNGTIFNQEKFSCQWWYEVNCSRAPNFYQLNDNLYKSLPGHQQQHNQQPVSAAASINGRDISRNPASAPASAASLAAGDITTTTTTTNTNTNSPPQVIKRRSSSDNSSKKERIVLRKEKLSSATNLLAASSAS